MSKSFALMLFAMFCCLIFVFFYSKDPEIKFSKSSVEDLKSDLVEFDNMTAACKIELNMKMSNYSDEVKVSVLYGMTIESAKELLDNEIDMKMKDCEELSAFAFDISEKIKKLNAN